MSSITVPVPSEGLGTVACRGEMHHMGRVLVEEKEGG